MNLWVIFITGLTIGGLTCLAVQGGLLASVISARKKELRGKKEHSSRIIPTLTFIITKLLSYTLLGFVLGAFGNAIGISQTAQAIMQIIAGLYMLAIAMNLLDIHPIFRYALIQPPRFLTRQIKNQARSKDIFAPGLLGAMTIFIPCGTTLAVEAIAISSANPFMGALIMGTFILGTTPLFFGIGYITSLLGENYRKVFLKVAFITMIYLGISSVNGGLIVLNFPLNSQKILSIFQNANQKMGAVKLYSEQLTQNPEIVITSYGYTPNYIRVKKGVLTKLKVTSKDAYSCASAFRIPSLGVSKNFQANETEIITFTPNNKGNIIFTCSMGMYSGVIEVI